MYAGLDLKPPFFEIGPKAFLYDQAVLDLAGMPVRSVANTMSGSSSRPRLSISVWWWQAPRDLLGFCPAHGFAAGAGRGVGSILPEAVKAAGAVGVLLNHVEKRLSMDELERDHPPHGTRVGLASMACADNLDDAVTIARMAPNIIIVESPDLIGAGRCGKRPGRPSPASTPPFGPLTPRSAYYTGPGSPADRMSTTSIAAGSQARRFDQRDHQGPRSVCDARRNDPRRARSVGSNSLIFGGLIMTVYHEDI